MEHAWKACVGVILLPWVRIPLSPPFLHPQRSFTVGSADARAAFVKKRHAASRLAGQSRQRVVCRETRREVAGGAGRGNEPASVNLLKIPVGKPSAGSRDEAGDEERAVRRQHPTQPGERLDGVTEFVQRRRERHGRKTHRHETADRGCPRGAGSDGSERSRRSARSGGARVAASRASSRGARPRARDGQQIGWP